MLTITSKISLMAVTYWWLWCMLQWQRSIYARWRRTALPVTWLIHDGCHFRSQLLLLCDCLR